ncbi:MAG TPA: F0F1 ATP synthase subunit A [Rhizomicrobium sp.]|nr:F0F1 ATP synthase subunit A [Rhizomicrobium sp.]
MAASPMEQFAVKPLIPLHLGGYDVSFTNEALWMCIVVGAVSLFMAVAVSNRKLVPSRIQSMAEMSYEFVANMINMTSGEAGLKFFPFIFTIFMFIAASNFFGLIPGSFTVTSQICVTFVLTALVIVTVIITGFIRHGLGFFKLFVPKAPLGILLFLVPLEVISFCARPMSLSMRLFANMLAGHTMLKVMAGFVVALGTTGTAMAVLSAGPMLLIIGLAALEFLVAFLQAYVFAILSCIYLSEALHLHDNH